MLRWTEPNASWSNRSVVATCEHMNSTSFNNRLPLMGGDVEPGRYCPGNPRPMAPKDLGAKAASPRVATLETLAPTISESVVLYGVPPTPGTSVANITVGH
jgi:hypothetical protein